MRIEPLELLTGLLPAGGRGHGESGGPEWACAGEGADGGGEAGRELSKSLSVLTEHLP